MHSDAASCCCKCLEAGARQHCTASVDGKHASLLFLFPPVHIHTARSHNPNTPATGAMWDDEDNNPYGSFARHDSNSSDVPGLASPGARKAPFSRP